MMRVLVIEDDPSTARSVALILRSEGHSCEVCGLGTDGVEAAGSGGHDVIVLDLMLPDIDGYEVLSRLRARHVGTPILILSGLASLDHKLKGLGVGADAYLTKPFKKQDLLAQLQAILPTALRFAVTDTSAERRA